MKLILLFLAILLFSACSVAEPVEESLFQTLYNYSGIKTDGVEYTNDTGKPIAWTLRLNSYYAECPFWIMIDGNYVITATATSDYMNWPETFTMIVPNGSTYEVRVIGAGGVDNWIEVY